MTDQHELTIKKTIRAPRKAVFEAWLDANALQQFMCPAPGDVAPHRLVHRRVSRQPQWWLDEHPRHAQLDAQLSTVR